MAMDTKFGKYLIKNIADFKEHIISMVEDLEDFEDLTREEFGVGLDMFLRHLSTPEVKEYLTDAVFSGEDDEEETYSEDWEWNCCGEEWSKDSVCDVCSGWHCNCDDGFKKWDIKTCSICAKNKPEKSRKRRMQSLESVVKNE